MGDQLRQRCSWCGAVLLDYDLSRTAVALDKCPLCFDLRKSMPEGLGVRDCPQERCRGDGYLDSEHPEPATWPVGSLVLVDGGMSTTLEHEDGAQLPPNACGQLPHDITGAVARG